MSKLKQGDRVKMQGVPFTVTVLELGECHDEGCNEEVFRFKDPESGEDDWIHSSDFAVQS